LKPMSDGFKGKEIDKEEFKEEKKEIEQMG
jgi:hypothetical protein